MHHFKLNKPAIIYFFIMPNINLLRQTLLELSASLNYRRQKAKCMKRFHDQR